MSFLQTKYSVFSNNRIFVPLLQARKGAKNDNIILRIFYNDLSRGTLLYTIFEGPCG
jgi:hypothetical protein